MEVGAQYLGDVNFPTATEGPFNGVVWGVIMTVTVGYDNSQIPSEGPYEFETANGTNGIINIEVGELGFTAQSDNSQTTGWPIIQFNNGALAGLSYFCSFSLNDVPYQFTVDGLDWEITNTQTNQVVASGNIGTTPIS